MTETQVTCKCDVAILGSGFAGSLMALILTRIGLQPVLIDKSRHPRFAIGESSTPVANIVLRDLALRYNLTRVLPLVKWGTWQRAYPEIGCGLKRGFSYFQHESGRPFQPRDDHSNELLVAASSDDEHSDTQWFRADVDRFLMNEAKEAGATVWESTTIEHLSYSKPTWSVRTNSDLHGIQNVEAKFIIDSTGEGSVLPKMLGFPSHTNRLLTTSRTIFSHFRHVEDWKSILEAKGGKVGDHPFCCDDAAQHQIFDRAWAWVLRFANGITSLGIVLDERKYPLDPTRPILDEWNEWLARYPSLRELVARVEVVDPPGRLVRTGRIQRCWSRAAGESWALLPHTAGFIDPLHSSGIAHSLCGIERLSRVLGQHWQQPEMESALQEYERIVLDEVAHIDRLVDGCFLSFGRFQLVVPYSMLYFAAATDYERRRSRDRDFTGSFLGADNLEFSAVVRTAHRELCELLARDPTEQQQVEYGKRLINLLQPFNHVGLGRPEIPNMYRHTAAPDL